METKWNGTGIFRWMSTSVACLLLMKSGVVTAERFTSVAKPYDPPDQQREENSPGWQRPSWPVRSALKVVSVPYRDADGTVKFRRDIINVVPDTPIEFPQKREIPAPPPRVRVAKPSPPAPQAPKALEFGVDFRVSTFPNYPGKTRERTIADITNYFVNQQSDHNQICVVDYDLSQRDCSQKYRIDYFVVPGSSGRVSLETCLPQRNFKILANYPYECKSGVRSPTRFFRPDWLAYRLMIQANYHFADQVPLNQSEIRAKIGTPISYNNLQIKRKIISNSFVSKDLRAIGAVTDRGKLVAITTFDFNVENKKGPESSYVNNPLNVETDAAEVFYLKPNGL